MGGRNDSEIIMVSSSDYDTLVATGAYEPVEETAAGAPAIPIEGGVREAEVALQEEIESRVDGVSFARGCEGCGAIGAGRGDEGDGGDEADGTNRADGIGRKWKSLTRSRFLRRCCLRRRRFTNI